MDNISLTIIVGIIIAIFVSSLNFMATSYAIWLLKDLLKKIKVKPMDKQIKESVLTNEENVKRIKDSVLCSEETVKKLAKKMNEFKDETEILQEKIDLIGMFTKKFGDSFRFLINERLGDEDEDDEEEKLPDLKEHQPYE